MSDSLRIDALRVKPVFFTNAGGLYGHHLLNSFARDTTSTKTDFRSELRDIVARGINYREALQLRELMVDHGFQLRRIEGFWGQDQNQANMFFAALDQIVGSGFSELRQVYLGLKERDVISNDLTQREQEELEGLRISLSWLIRKNILQNGGGEEFIKSNKLTTLDKRFGDLLAIYLPGIIDEEKEHSIRPHEVWQGCWDHEAYAEKQFFIALGKVQDLKMPVDTYLKYRGQKEALVGLKRKEMDHAVSRLVIAIDHMHLNGGIKNFLRDNLDGFSSIDRSYIEGQGQASIFQHFIPELEGKIDFKARGLPS